MSLALQAASQANDRAAGIGRFLHLLSGRRVSLLAAIAFGALVPTALVVWLTAAPQTDVPATAFAAFAAALAALVVHHKVAAFAHADRALLVPVAFAGTYVVAWLVFLLTPLDHSGLLLGASFVLTTVWFYAVERVAAAVRPVLVYVPLAGDRVTETSAPSLQLELPLDDLACGEPAEERPEAEWTIARSPFDSVEHAGGVVADLRGDVSAEWRAFLTRSALAGTPVYDLTALRERTGGVVELDHLADNDLSVHIADAAYVGIKRAIDLLGALLLAPFVLLIAAVVAIAIKLDDGGPVFFRQERIGHRGQPFAMLKFRSMRHASVGANATGAGDARITRVGALLRRCKLDELPQIVNIVRGEMSWIGPRPEPLSMARRYRTYIANYDYRHIVRPGITGWAQVNQGYVEEDLRGATTKLHHDFYYIRNFSPWLDLLIVLRTVVVVLTGFGAR